MARLCSQLSQLTVDDWEWVIWSYKNIAHPSPQPSTLEVETHWIRVGTNIYGDYSEKMAQMDQEDGFMSWGRRGSLDGPNSLFGIVYHVIYHFFEPLYYNECFYLISSASSHITMSVDRITIIKKKRAVLKQSGAYIDAEEIWPMNYCAMLFTTEAKTNLQCDCSLNYTGNNTSSHITICAAVLVVPTSG
ncbi:hypothetical protein BKA82DRAFT_4011535 [Pisolithus tinctorius]|nr:hypothetical protein BKA82DRAFT_4011535 [Pisolithus tinctorius]